MRRLRLLAPLIAAILLTALAAPALADSPVENFSIKWRGNQEVIESPLNVTTVCAPPAVCGDPDAVGHAQIQIRPDDNTVCFTLTWARVDGDVFAAHIHPGAAGDAGGVITPLFGPGSFGSQGAVHDCVTETAADIAAILANPSAFYVNIHSSAFPAGALRGQLE